MVIYQNLVTNMKVVDNSELVITHEKCPNIDFFWSVFSCIRTEQGDLLRKSIIKWIITTFFKKKKKNWHGEEPLIAKITVSRSGKWTRLSNFLVNFARFKNHFPNKPSPMQRIFSRVYCKFLKKRRFALLLKTAVLRILWKFLRSNCSEAHLKQRCRVAFFNFTERGL